MREKRKKKPPEFKALSRKSLSGQVFQNPEIVTFNADKLILENRHVNLKIMLFSNEIYLGSSPNIENKIQKIVKQIHEKLQNIM